MIFISFSSKNLQQATAINAQLLSCGVKTWFSPVSIKTSANYANDIASAIKNSQAVVLIYSKDANDSVHVQKEIDLAITYKKKIYPLRIDDATPSEGMEYLLSGIQWRDMAANIELSMKSFINELKADLGLYEDATKKLSESNIESFCMQHFKGMGYKIEPKKKAFWGTIASACDYPQEALEYLSSNAFCAKKEKTTMIVVAKYLESSTLPNFKVREADYFWKARKLLWKREALLQVCKEQKVDVEDEEIDFKTKSNIAERYRHEDSSKKALRILFYLFVQNPPLYRKQSYTLPLNNEFDYKENEPMPQLYLNYSYMPKWWGYGKDDLEKIKYYEGFRGAFEKLRFEELKRSRTEYEHYDGRVAETLAEVFLKRNDLIVQKFGAESLLGNSINFMQRSNMLEDAQAAQTIKRFMTAPDILAIKLDEKDRIVNSYFMDVKYRTFASKELFLQSIKNGGELYSQAKKYQQNWDRVYLFLFLHLSNAKSVEVYILPVKDILEDGFEPLEIRNDYNFGWLENDEIEKLHKKAEAFWVK